MLTPHYLDVLPEPIVALYDEYMQTVVNDIARRLAGLDFARPTAAWQMQRLTESGKVYEAALEELSRLTGKSEVVLQDIFARAGVKAVRFDDAIYRAAGLSPLPLHLSPAMGQVLAAGLRKTQGIMRNLTQTTAASGQDAFVRAADLAYMQITGGAFDYQSALKQAIRRVAGEGLQVAHYASGRHDQLDVALRRTILTGVNQTAAQLQTTRAAEMGADLVQTTAHAGARPSHAEWQGKVFSRSGTSRKYPGFVEATGYGTGAGLCGWNCRHSFHPWIEGLSPDVYRDAGIDPRQDKTVTYHGQAMSFYEATQRQRAIERKIRRSKREASALEAAGLDSSAERAAVRRHQAEMREFVRQTGIDRQRFREQIYDGANVRSRAS